MKTSWIRLLCVLAPFALGACEVQEAPTSVVSRLKPNLVEAVEPYRFNDCSGNLAPGEAERIRRFLHDLWLTPQDVLIVTLPKGRNTTRDVQRRRTMTSLLFSVPAQKRFIGANDFRDNCKSDSEGIIRVVRTVSVEADCERGVVPDGCTNASNLAAMIANPSDTFLPPQTATGGYTRSSN
ncbi:hypothetical protein [Roseovarius sp.]|uniref:hypothetical protein n=1 Tax=Roseovarius sp. TaxID=1486281 RepID=UPI003BAC3F88